MHRFFLLLALSALLVGVASAAPDDEAPTGATAPAWTRWKGKTGRPRFPADLGPDTIDVSRYPTEYQATYRTRFQTLCASCHSLARAVNSELLELTPEEMEAFRKETPRLTSSPPVWKTGEGVWHDYLIALKMRPPCCGGCPVLTSRDVQRIGDFLVYDSKVRKTGSRAASWEEHRTDLIQRFEKANPERYEELYGAREGASLP